VIWVLAILVLLETRDLGGGLLYFGIFLAMLYVATARIAYVAGGLDSSSSAPSAYGRSRRTCRTA